MWSTFKLCHSKTAIELRYIASVVAVVQTVYFHLDYLAQTRRECQLLQDTTKTCISCFRCSTIDWLLQDRLAQGPGFAITAICYRTLGLFIWAAPHRREIPAILSALSPMCPQPVTPLALFSQCKAKNKTVAIVSKIWLQTFTHLPWNKPHWIQWYLLLRRHL